MVYPVLPPIDSNAFCIISEIKSGNILPIRYVQLCGSVKTLCVTCCINAGMNEVYADSLSKTA